MVRQGVMLSRVAEAILRLTVTGQDLHLGLSVLEIKKLHIAH